MANQFNPHVRQSRDPEGYRWSEFENKYVPTLTPDGPMAPPLEVDTKVDATSDERTVNNLMRHQYRVLSDEEKAAMQLLKDIGLEFVEVLHKVGGSAHHFEVDGDRARQSSRELSIAQTKIEEAVMWAVKHLTR